MIRATFDVRGNTLAELMQAARTTAEELVGGLRYEFDMEISQRVPAGELELPRWVAECEVDVQGPYGDRLVGTRLP